MSLLRSWITAAGIGTMSHVALAAPVLFAGSLSADDATYRRTLPGSAPVGLSIVGTAVAHDVYAFHVTADGTYVMETLSAAFTNGRPDDTFISLYQNAFDPAAALTNVLEADDESGLGGLSSITRSLSAGVNYFLVVTSYGNGQLGGYTGRLDTMTGAGQVTFGPVQINSVPEPVMAALVPMALAGLAWTRRRRKA